MKNRDNYPWHQDYSIDFPHKENNSGTFEFENSKSIWPIIQKSQNLSKSYFRYDKGSVRTSIWICTIKKIILRNLIVVYKFCVSFAFDRIENVRKLIIEKLIKSN